MGPGEEGQMKSAERMDGLVPQDALRVFQEAGVEIVRELSTEGFDVEDIESFLRDKLFAEPAFRRAKGRNG